MVLWKSNRLAGVVAHGGLIVPTVVQREVRHACAQKFFFRRVSKFHVSPPPPLSAFGSFSSLISLILCGQDVFLVDCKEFQYQEKITYPNSSLISVFDASNGTFCTTILELFCFVAVAVLRYDTLSLKNTRRQFQQMEKLQNCNRRKC